MSTNTINEEIITECLMDGRINLITDPRGKDYGILFEVAGKTFPLRRYIGNLSLREFYLFEPLDSILRIILNRIEKLRNDDKETYKFVKNVILGKMSHHDVLMHSLCLA